MGGAPGRRASLRDRPGRRPGGADGPPQTDRKAEGHAMTTILMILELIAKIGGKLFLLAQKGDETPKNSDQAQIHAPPASRAGAAQAAKHPRSWRPPPG